MTTQEAAAPADPSPAQRIGTPVDGVNVLAALSPSRAGDFLSCPLLFRFRTVDRLPEPPSVDALRGTVVHLVLERLFDLPAADRTPALAESMVETAWEQVLLDEPEAGFVFEETGRDVVEWLDSARASVRSYFDLEDPTAIEPSDRELYVETLLESKLLLRGFVDRVDVAPDGTVSVVDYKTGQAVREGFEARAFFQLRIYALALWRMRGVVPGLLKLVYLGSGEVVTWEPDEEQLLATERKVEAVWRAITYAQQTGDYRPNRSALCAWCAHQALCPAWGGTPPPIPVREPDEVQPA